MEITLVGTLLPSDRLDNYSEAIRRQVQSVDAPMQRRLLANRLIDDVIALPDGGTCLILKDGQKWVIRESLDELKEQLL